MEDSAPEARLATLLEGNRRFASGAAQGPNRDHVRRVRISEGQNPHALVLCCSDSREVPELIFDCGLGDLFVVRTAGHCVGATVLASVEFGVLVLGIKLVVVLGHTRCGAIAASLRARHEQEGPRGHLPALMKMIRPAVDDVSLAGPPHDALAEQVMLQHVRRSISVIEESADWEEHPLIVGGRYDLESGLVSLVDR